MKLGEAFKKSEAGGFVMGVEGPAEKVKVHAREILGVRWTRPRIAVVGACLLVVFVVLGFVGVGMWKGWRAARVAAELRGKGVVFAPNLAGTFWQAIGQVLTGPTKGAVNTGNIIDSKGALRTPRDVERLLVFPELRYLNLGQCPLSGELVEVLSRFLHLEGIGLDDSRAGDRELESLTRLSKLRALQLLKSEVSDEGVKLFAKFPELRSLMLESGKIGGEGYGELKSLSKLETLWIRGKTLDDQGLEKLVKGIIGLRQLHMVGLQGTSVTDAGLGCLVKLKDVTQVEFSETSITDAGLMTLKGMPRLMSVHLTKCRVSAAGVRAFEKAVPRVNVTTDLGGGSY